MYSLGTVVLISHPFWEHLTGPRTVEPYKEPDKASLLSKLLSFKFLMFVEKDEMFSSHDCFTSRGFWFLGFGLVVIR